MDKDGRGGKREGAGRKPSAYPLCTKEFRATEQEWADFMRLLPGDARDDFVRLLTLLLDAQEEAGDKQIFEAKEE